AGSCSAGHPLPLLEKKKLDRSIDAARRWRRRRQAPPPDSPRRRDRCCQVPHDNLLQRRRRGDRSEVAVGDRSPPRRVPRPHHRVRPQEESPRPHPLLRRQPRRLRPRQRVSVSPLFINLQPFLFNLP
uniref:Uncharacterized protein n=1 Tax=Aegilops tauschii subsp. strangulata TaxID=200361 RepID=A0A453E863_AEGTS